MATTLQCSCGQHIRLSDDFAHRFTTCPACGARLTIDAEMLDFEYVPAPEKAPGAFACASCSKWFPPEQLKQIDGELICGRCRLRIAEAARAQKAMITNAIVVGVLILAGAALYMFVLKDLFSGKGGGPAKTKDAVAAKDASPKPPVDPLLSAKDHLQPAPPIETTDPTLPEPPVTDRSKPDPPVVTPTPVAPQPAAPIDLTNYTKATLIAVAAKSSTVVTFHRSGLLPAAHELRIFDAATGREVQSRVPFSFRIDGMAISDDGRHLMTVGREGHAELRLYDVATLTVKLQSKVLEPFGKVGIMPDGLTAWCLGPQEGMWLIDARSSRVELFKGTDITSAYAEFAPKRKLAAVKCISTTGQWVDLYDLSSRRRLHRLDPRERFGCVTISPDGSILALGFGDRIDLYDTRNWRIAKKLERGRKINAPERLLITEDNKHLVELPFGADGRTPVIRTLPGNETKAIDAQNCIDWTIGPRGELVVASEGEPIKRFEIKTGKAVE